VTSQFHVIYDELFTTVGALDGPFNADTWNDLFINHREYISDEDDVPPELADEWLTQDEIRRRQRAPEPLMAPLGPIDAPQNPGQAITDAPEPDPAPSQAPATTQPEPTHDPEVLNPEPEHEVVFARITSDDEAEPDIDQWPDDHEPVDPEEIEHTDEQDSIDGQEEDEQEPHLEPQPGRRQPHRANRGINRRYVDFFALSSIIAGTPFATRQTHPTLAHGDGFFKTLDWDEPPKNLTSKALSFLAAVTFDDELRHDTLMSTYPTILAVKANDADLPSFAEAMASDDCDGFCKAMDPKI
jgi:hypothetical protein